MFVGIYSIYDRVAEHYMPAFFQKSDAVAIRLFVDGVHQEQNAMFRDNPDDFELRFLGSYDDESGQITGCTPGPIVLMTVEAAMRARAEALQMRHDARNAEMIQQVTNQLSAKG